MSLEESGINKFPKSPRFFNHGTNLPDLKSYKHSRDSKAVFLNNQSANINYNPYNSAQQKTKAIFPIDFFHVHNRIILPESGEETTTPSNEIPSFKLDPNDCSDPIKIIESFKDAGKQHGAIKLILPESIETSFRQNFQLNPDLFWFQSNKLLNNPTHNELQNRLRFHKELIRFHMDKISTSAKNREKAKEASAKSTPSNLDQPNKIPSHSPPRNSDSRSPTIQSLLSHSDTTSDGPSSSKESKHSPDVTTPNPELKTPKNKLPPFLNKLPMIDKRPLDLYKLFRSVLIRGGYAEVINRKLWAQIGRELGYKGKIMTSLSSSLKTSYLRILYPFELSLGDRKFELVGLTSSTTELPTSVADSRPPTSGSNSFNKNGFNLLNDDPEDNAENVEPSRKKVKHENPPLILGSSKDFNRSIQLKASKGILLNSPHLVDIKQSNIFTYKDVNDSSELSGGTLDPQIKKSPDEASTSHRKKNSRESASCPITPQSQVNHLLKSYMENQAWYQDKSRNESNGKQGSIYTLRQFMEKDAKFQEFLMNANQTFFKGKSCSTPNATSTQSHSQLNSGNKHSSHSNGSNNHHHSNGDVSLHDRNAVSMDDLEELFWSVVSSGSAKPASDRSPYDGSELENGSNISSLINGSGFVKIGDDLLNYKNHLVNLSSGQHGHNFNGSSGNTPTTLLSDQNTFPAQLNGSSPQHQHKNMHHNHSSSKNNLNVDANGQNHTFNCNELHYYNSQEYINKMTHAALNPWNLHNIPVLPNSLLGALSENDIHNQDLVNPVLNIGMTFSTENWKCEDHFTQLANYQFFGSHKRWYIIPESEFEKFETLIQEVNASNKDRVNINNGEDRNWNFDELLQFFTENGDIGNVEYEALVNSLENMVNPYPDYRMENSDPIFQALISYRKAKGKQFSFNQDFLITPDLLDSRGIRYTTTVQKPGELIIKFPKTYSSTISFGLNFSEEVNLATEVWLDYAIEGEKWLEKQSLLPNFSTFKLLTNVAQLYDSSNSNNIHFNSNVYSKVLKLYTSLYTDELQSRRLIRKRVTSIKEFLIDEKSLGDTDAVSDDSLSNVYPSKVVITNKNNNQSFNLTLQNFLELVDLSSSEDESKSSQVPQIIDNPLFKVELHLFCSDDRLKNYFKILDGYVADYELWMTNYESLVQEQSDLSLRVYKSALAEGEKLFATISSSNYLYLLDSLSLPYRPTRESGSDTDNTRYNTFKSYIENLKLFIDKSNDFIEDCQRVLSIKHQQRIRNVNSPPSSSDAKAKAENPHTLQTLLDLVDKIPLANFSCPEFEKIIEFKNEIENFDRACKSSIAKQSKNIEEFEDLINLGESFGIKLPSLDFIKRIRDVLSWNETFEVIVSGGDPFSDKKYHFTLQHLKDFFDFGIECLGKDSINKIETVELLIKNSENFMRSTVDFLNSNQYANTVDLSTLEAKIKEIEKRVRAKGTDRLFVNLETYDRLAALSANSDIILDFNKFETSEYNVRFPYHEIKQLSAMIHESGLKFNDSIISTSLAVTESVTSEIWKEFKDYLIVTTLDKSNISKNIKEELNSKMTLNSELVTFLQTVLVKNEFSFDSDSDVYESSSTYATLKESETETPNRDGEIQSDHESSDEAEDHGPMRYCLCREYEYGTMIECDRCNEWYHTTCVNEPEDQENVSEDDHYACPMCRLVASQTMKDEFLSKQTTMSQVKQILDRTSELKIYSVNETSKFTELYTQLQDSREYFFPKVDMIMSKDITRDEKISQLKFILRKVYGAAILIEDLCSALLQEVRSYQAEAEIEAKQQANSLISGGAEDQQASAPPPSSPSSISEINKASYEGLDQVSASSAQLATAAVKALDESPERVSAQSPPSTTAFKAPHNGPQLPAPLPPSTTAFKSPHDGPQLPAPVPPSTTSTFKAPHDGFSQQLPAPVPQITTGTSSAPGDEGDQPRNETHEPRLSSAAASSS